MPQNATVEMIESVEFDQVFEIREDGGCSTRHDLYAPEMVWTDGDVWLEGWDVFTKGWSGAQGGNHRDGIMHPSEFLGGALSRAVAESPGLYALVVVDDIDDLEHPVGWALVTRETV